MSYFHEIEFTVPKDPNEVKVTKPTIVFNPERLTTVVQDILNEVEKIKLGQSTLTKYAINPGKFNMPCIHRLTMFQAEPSEENYKAFLERAKHELGNKAAIAFFEMLENAKEVEHE